MVMLQNLLPVPIFVSMPDNPGAEMESNPEEEILSCTVPLAAFYLETGKNKRTPIKQIFLLSLWALLNINPITGRTQNPHVGLLVNLARAHRVIGKLQTDMVKTMEEKKWKLKT